MSPFNKKLNRIDGRLAAYATLAGAALAAPAIPSADATIIYSGPVAINIPSTTAGVYLNVVTGVFNTNPALVPGWDVNPYSSTALTLFNPGAPAGGVYVVNAPGGSSATAPDNLPFLAYLISAASGFGSGSVETTGPTAFILNSSNNIAGFRFVEATVNGGATCYGWMRISLSATTGSQPRAIVEYAYDDSGAGIMAGDVPEPSTVALLGVMAAGAVGVRAWRKRKAA